MGIIDTPDASAFTIEFGLLQNKPVKAVALLAPSEASYITSIILNVTGGC